MLGIGDLRLDRVALCVGLAVVALCSCHAQQPSAPRSAPAQTERVVVGVSAGTAVATLVRPTPGVLRMSLFIDAGSRDATPPQLATLAAWIAAARAGRGVNATVFPDATELALQCESTDAAHCASMLQTALSTRAPSEAEVQAARMRLQAARREALARDPERQADALALHGLLGEPARGFFPLGSAEDDGQCDLQSVAAFLRTHYGPTRALLVAAGDARPEQIHELVARTVARAPAAAHARAARTLTVASAPRLELAVADRAVVSLAIAAADIGRAQAFADSLQRSVQQASPGSPLHLQGSVFEARGGALALLHVHGAEQGDTLGRSVRALAWLLVEPPGASLARTAADDLSSVAQTLGVRWSAAGPASSDLPAFAAGALADGGRGDQPRVKDPNAAVYATYNTRLQAIFDQALASARPRVRGPSDAYAASVVTDNGGRIDVRVTTGERVAIAVRNALGAERDPPLLHGRAALLATLSTTACAGGGPEALQAELQALGATLLPRVDAQSYGVLLELPRAHWRQGIELALRCVQAPSADALAFSDAALRLQARLAGARSAQRMRAQVAALVTPAAPGLCAPWGNPQLIGNLNARTLSEWSRETTFGAAWAVAISGALPVSEAVERVARRIARMPAGRLPPAVQPAEPVTQATGQANLLAPSSEGSDVLVVWQARAARATPAAAQVLATALSVLLSRQPGATLLWREGDAHSWGAWAAVALHVSAELAPRLAELMAQAGRGLSAETLEPALVSALDTQRRAEAAAGSKLGVRTERIARARLGELPSESALPQARETLELLLRARPTWVGLD